MAVKEILTFENESLHKKCERVNEINDEIKEIVRDLKDTLFDGDGVGLAAPQIGILKRIAIVDLREGNGPIVLINPKMISFAGKEVDIEGCLSHPGYLGEVARPKKITVVATDENGRKKVHKVQGFLARAFCHEMDHLDGVVYTDRTNKIFEEEVEK